MNWSALFAYRDGLLYWKSPGPGRQLDKPAGSVRQDGYHAINVGKKKYRAHRIIWEMHNGPIPEGLVVDHIDADPGNNRIENLRVASIARNNTRSVSSANSGGKVSSEPLVDAFKLTCHWALQTLPWAYLKIRLMLR